MGNAGLTLGISIGKLATMLNPWLPVYTTWIFTLLSETIAIVIGLMAGAISARHAARLDRAVHGSYLLGAAILITSLVNAIQ